MDFRTLVLRRLLKDPPKGDLDEFIPDNRYKISCVFVFYKRIHLMETILSCLNEQTFSKEDFEVVLVEDRGGSEEGSSLKARFPSLDIKYHSPSSGWGLMGYMRNFGLSRAQGEIVLFLDDDTVIMDGEFLERLYGLFKSDERLMAVLPRGNASFCLLEGRYSYHDPFFFTSRCTAYRRDCLIKLRGFDSSFIGQEDVEFAIRFLARGYKFMATDEIQYYHPPLIVDNLNKAVAVGYSFSRSRYNLLFKFLLGINGARWLPRIIFPTKKNKYMARFSYGFILGFIKGMVGAKPPLYT